MCIIKFSTQQHNGIYDKTNNLKIIISVRGGGNLLFLQCLYTHTHIKIKLYIYRTPPLPTTQNIITAKQN